ncbi:ribonuclease H-like domain-containing protein [Tanacetum coccineum]
MEKHRISKVELTSCEVGLRPRAVNTARPYTSPVNAVRAKRVNVVKTSACWVWRPTRPNGASLVFKRNNYIDARGRSKGKPQLDDKGFVDSGCSRHMTRNIAYLSDFKEFDRGYVTFGGGTHGGRISGKGTLKTDCLDFEDVYFVNELKFNLFSVSQMRDKKNYVLFTNTECLVLSPNFKLPDESHILLKIPRKDNIYSFDMKNIVLKENLTCFVTKATLDESMLWHRRLGHINFKNINKLVKENHVKLEIPKAHHISKDISLSLYSVGDLWLNFGMIWVNTDIEVCLMVLTFIHGLYIDMDPHEFSHVYLVVSRQKVNTASTNINASMLPLVLLEGNLVFLITVEIFKALTSFIGEVEIKATIDGHDKTITEASVRSSLQLADADGISNMSTTEIFKQLALMRYVTDSDHLTCYKNKFPLNGSS